MVPRNPSASIDFGDQFGSSASHGEPGQALFVNTLLTNPDRLERWLNRLENIRGVIDNRIAAIDAYLQNGQRGLADSSLSQLLPRLQEQQKIGSDLITIFRAIVDAKDPLEKGAREPGPKQQEFKKIARWMARTMESRFGNIRFAEDKATQKRDFTKALMDEYDPKDHTSRFGYGNTSKSRQRSLSSRTVDFLRQAGVLWPTGLHSGGEPVEFNLGFPQQAQVRHGISRPMVGPNPGSAAGMEFGGGLAPNITR